jgi:hypothetical protein
MDEVNPSSTHYEYVGDGYHVRWQHCEHRDDVTGEVCDVDLGCNYPSDYCLEHRDLH